MNTPLFDQIAKYNPNLRLHMPGHSGETNISPLYANAQFDVTELSFSDNLLDAKGVILQAEKLMAECFGSKYCLFFTNGCTSALFTAILVAKQKVNKFYCLQTPHKSIINAFELFGLDFEIVDDLPQNACGIVVTSPNYYGQVIDVAIIRNKHPNAFIIVDEAHGAHFAFSSLLPKNNNEQADFVANGMHKTLPVFTGGAILRTNSAELYQKALEYRAKVHSTSPSYLIMCSMDYARGYMQQYGEQLFAKLKQKVDNLTLPNGFKRIQNHDFSRLVIQVPQGANGYDIASDAEKKGIFFELVEKDKLVAILTPFNMDKLNLLGELNANATPLKKVDLTKYIGTIAQKDIGLYPPGKVYIKKGEIITEQVIALLQAEAQRVFGLD